MVKTKVLVIGASGLLGSKLYEHFSTLQDYQVIGTGLKYHDRGLRYYDITSKDFSLFKETKPDVVIHSAGVTNVDYCEKNQEEAGKVNFEGTENVIEACKLNNSKLVYFSTDFVFDGKKGDYKEEDAPNPLSYYARTKLKSEQIVKNSGLDYLILRVAVLYSAKQNGKFVDWCITQLRTKHYIDLVADHIRTPTLVDDIAQALDFLLKNKKSGIYHVAGSERLSAYSMGLRIAEVFNLEKEYIKPILSNKFKQPAQRPRDSSLNTQKLRSDGIKMSGFVEGLEKIKTQLR